MVAADKLLTIGKSVTSHSDTKYRVLQWIGKGGNCHVFLVVALSGERRGLLFAIKIFCRIEKESRLQQFLDESEFLKACDHPSIMKVRDDGELRVPSGGTVTSYPFVVADYYPATLAQAMTDRLWISNKVIYILQLLSGLNYLSSLQPQVVHRDIKPQNIFIRGFDCVFGDFGLMKKLDVEPDVTKEEAVAAIATGDGPEQEGIEVGSSEAEPHSAESLVEEGSGAESETARPSQAKDTVEDGESENVELATDEGEIIFKMSKGPGMPKFYRTPDLVDYANNVAPLTVSSDIFQLGLVAAELFCGKSPLKDSREMLGPIELYDLHEVPGSLGGSIKDAIAGMLVIRKEHRPSVVEMLDQWEGIMNQVATQYNSLEGRVF